MANNKKIATTRKAKTLSRISLFGPPPLIEGEDAAAYDELSAHVADTVKPTDFIEEMFVRDVVDITWTIFRLRRIQAKFLSDKVSDEVWRRCRIEDMADASPEIRNEMQARVILNNFESFAKIEHSTAISEGRRNATLREVERHRATLGQMLREKICEVENAEYEVVDETVAANTTHKKAA